MASTSSKTIKTRRRARFRLPDKNYEARVSKDYGRKIEASRPEIKEEDLIVPQRYKDNIKRLLKANGDVVANTDQQLGQTGTVQMKIENGDHPFIRLRP